MTYKFSNLKSSIHSTLYTLCTQHSTQTTQTTLLPTVTNYTLSAIHYTLSAIHYTLGRVLGGGSVSHSVPRIIQRRFAPGAPSSNHEATGKRTKKQGHRGS